MILRFIVCVLLVVLILFIAKMLAEKIRDILEEGNYKKMCERYLSQAWQVLKQLEALDSCFSKRLKKLETDFKTHDGLLKNRLTDIESVVKDWKDTMAGAVAYNHGCTECNSGDSKEPHPKTKPKHLAEKGTEA